MYSEEWLYGSIRSMSYDIRGCWPDLQAMASKPPFFGSICIAANIGYSTEQLAGLFNTPVDILKNALNIFKGKGWITIDNNNIITLTEWERFQSDYLRTKNAPSRKSTTESTEKSTTESTPKCLPTIRLDQIRLDQDIEREENKRINTCAKAHFVKPTIQEISDYCKERKNSVNPESFFDFYESKGWLVGKNKMKDWKAAVRTWEKNNFGNSYSNKPKQSFEKNIGSKYDNIKKDVINVN